MTIRRATLAEADVDAIVHHRRAMFRDMGYNDEAALEAMSRSFRPWLVKKMEDGEYLAWFTTANSPGGAPGGGTVAAGLGLWLMDWPPHMVAAGRWRGNILNVYTEPDYRRRGLARGLMEVALGWCAANNVGAIILHASEQGRALYESLGFTPTNEMRLIQRAG